MTLIRRRTHLCALKNSPALGLMDARQHVSSSGLVRSSVCALERMEEENSKVVMSVMSSKAQEQMQFLTVCIQACKEGTERCPHPTYS